MLITTTLLQRQLRNRVKIFSGIQCCITVRESWANSPRIHTFNHVTVVDLQLLSHINFVLPSPNQLQIQTFLQCGLKTRHVHHFSLTKGLCELILVPLCDSDFQWKFAHAYIITKLWAILKCWLYISERLWIRNHLLCSLLEKQTKNPYRLRLSNKRKRQYVVHNKLFNMTKINIWNN